MLWANPILCPELRKGNDYNGNPSVTDASSPKIEAEMARLEANLRQLKIQYDMFFSGALPRAPHELRVDVERLIKRYSTTSMQKYAHRFRFNSLVSRFNSLSELWGKTIRTREEGERPVRAFAFRAGENVLTTCRIRDPIKEQELIRRLHARFLEARRKIESRNGKVSFESFFRVIASQAKNLRKKTRCDHIELRIIVEDKKVQLKARPGK